MGKLPYAAVGTLAILGVATFLLAATPDGVVCTEGGEYELCTPAEVVAAGGASGDVPAPPATGRFLLESSDTDLNWLGLDRILEEELGAELGNVEAKDLLRISSVDDGPPILVELESVSAGTVVQAGGGAFAADVKTLETQIQGLQSRTGPLGSTSATKGQVLTFDPTIQGANYGWENAPTTPLSAYGTVGTEGQCAKANSSRDGLDYGDCGGGGGGGGASLSNKAAVATGATAGAGSATEASRQDHVHPQTGLATSTALADVKADADAALTKANVAQTENDQQDTKIKANADAAAANKTDIATNKTAIGNVRQVPDPAHHAKGDVLTLGDSGAFDWAAPSGGGGGGGGGGSWELMAAKLNVLDLSFSADRTITLDLEDGVSAGDCYKNASTHDFLMVVSHQQQAWPLFAASDDRRAGTFMEWRWNGTADIIDGSYQDDALLLLSCGKSGTNDINFRLVVPNALQLSRVDFRLYQRAPGGGGGGGGGATPLSDGTPAPLGTASAGTGTAASRGDHVHQLPADIAANKTGVATNKTDIAKVKTDLATTDGVVAAQGTKIEANAAGVTANKNAIDAIEPLPDDAGASQNDVLLINADGNPEWNGGINQATHLNASNIVKNGNRIAQIDKPAEAESGGAFRPGYAYRLRSCAVSNSNRVCEASWEPGRDLIDTHTAANWSGTGSWTNSGPTAANLHEAMRTGFVPYRRFELSVEFEHNEVTNYYLIAMAGLPPGDTLGVTELARFLSQNSNNSLTGTLEWASVEIGPTSFAVTMAANTRGDKTVKFRLYGVR